MADDGAWQAAMDVLLAASEEQASEATIASAELIRDIARGLLSEKVHAWFTFSPSAAGEPPAAISGNLGASMTAELMSPLEAWVGPTGGFGRTEFYARIQELSGPMHGHPWMHFFLEGVWWQEQFIFLPPRPYLAPATDDAVDSGRVWQTYAEHQLVAILEAAG